MSELSPLTLAQLITSLKQLGDAPVTGLGDEISSYRGYYERNAVTAGYDRPASELVAAYESQIGKPIRGYKGGDFTVSENEYVYVSGYGECGPAIVGIFLGSDGKYHPVTEM